MISDDGSETRMCALKRYEAVYSQGQKFCMVQLCVAVLEMLHSADGKNILILRQRNLSKHCLLRFHCLNIYILSPLEPQMIDGWKDDL